MNNPQRARLRYWLRLVFSLVLSGFFLYLAVESLAGCPEGSHCDAGQCVLDQGSCGGEAPCVSCVDWSNLPGQLAHVSVWSIILFSLMYLGVHAVRVWRWYYLLRPLGQKEFRPVMRAGAIGLAAIVIFPLRLGELVRPYLIARDTPITMSSALGTAVVERVIDGLFVTLVLFITLAALPTRAESPAFVYTAGTVSALVFGSVMAVLMFSWWQRRATVAVLRRIGNAVSAKLTEKALRLLEGFLDGVATLKHGGNLYAFIALTFLYWGTNGVTLVYLANAFGIEITLAEGFAVTSILVIGIMVPGGPGHIGTYEFFLRAGLGLYVAVGEMPDRVLTFIAAIHVLQVLVQIIAGLPFYLTDSVKLSRAIEASESLDGGAAESSPS